MPCQMYPETDNAPTIPRSEGDKLTRLLCAIDKANESGDLASYLNSDLGWLEWRDKHRAEDARAEVV